MKIQLLVILLVILLTGCGEPAKKDTVVATNSWTAAFAKAAGAENVVVLAPFEMNHPAEYELRPSDIPVIAHARVIIFAGYETLVKRLQSGMNLKPEVLLKIDTDYSMATIEKSVMDIARRLGTEKIALRNIDSIRNLMSEEKAHFGQTGLLDTPVLVNFFQQSIVKEMGFKVAGIFGPAALEAGDIEKLAKTGSQIVIDNEHNPVGYPLKGVETEIVYRQLLNFPGLHHTVTLLDVIRYNIRQLNYSSEKFKQ